MSLSKPRPDEGERWLRLARRYLRFGTRSRAQLRTYLSNRHAPEAVIADIVEACSREGRIDDRVAAKLWVETLANRGYALSAIRIQLSDRGFDDHAIEQALNALRAREDDEQRARTMAAAFLKTSSGSASRGRRASVARRLARRGFDPELIDRLLAHYDE